MKNRKIVGSIVLAALVLIFAAASHAQRKPAAKAAAKPLPELTLNTVDGQKWSLSEQRGKLVLLNFWATWCAPCRTEIPILVQLADKYQNEDLRIAGVSVDSANIETIRRFIGEFKINYPILLTVPDSLLSEQKAVPMSLLINEKGVLAKKYVGAVEASVLEKDIENLLNKKIGKRTTKPKPNARKAARTKPE